MNSTWVKRSAKINSIYTNKLYTKLMHALIHKDQEKAYYLSITLMAIYVGMCPPDRDKSPMLQKSIGLHILPAPCGPQQWRRHWGSPSQTGLLSNHRQATIHPSEYWQAARRLPIWWNASAPWDSNKQWLIRTEAVGSDANYTSIDSSWSSRKIGIYSYVKH